MAQSAVDVCNSALQKCGVSSIMSLTDPTREARSCALAFDSNRRAELRKRNWNFAIKRKILGPDSAAPAFDYAYAFQLPSDCLKVIVPKDSSLDWVIEGRTILTNYGNGVLNLRYVADITDVTQWDSTFYDVFACSLALDVVEQLTNSPAKKRTLEQEYNEALADAAKANAFEKVSQRPPDPTFLTSRWV